MKSTQNFLRVFLCHAKEDKEVVRELYKKLEEEGWIDPWLDSEKLLPGQDWDYEIEKAVRNTNAVIACLSSSSVTKEGYIQKEIKFALNVELEKPKGTIFIIPLKLEECTMFYELSHLHWVNYYEDNGYDQLLRSLRARADSLSIVHEPDNVLAHIYRGLAHRKQGNHHQAITAYTRAIKVLPGYAYAYTVRGDSYDSLGRHELAITDYTKALELNPKDAYTYQMRGSTYYKLGQFSLAITDYTKSIELEPNNACIWCRRGYSYEATSDYKQAIAGFTKAVEIGPDCNKVHYRRGSAHLVLGEKEKAIADFRRCLELETDAVGHRISYYKRIEERLSR